MSGAREIAARGGAALLGAVLVAVAHVLGGTPVGALAGCGALVLASAGLGLAWGRAFAVPVSWGMGAAVGLALLLVASTLLGRAGLLPRGAQLGLVVAGIALLPLARPAAVDLPGGVRVFVAMGAVVLLGIEVVDRVAWISEGLNHTLAVKRLWDTGHLGAPWHQPGGLVVGCAFSALGGDAGLAGVFDSGVCATLLLLVLADELAGRRDPTQVVLFLVLATPLVLATEPAGGNVARWSGVLLHFTMFRALVRLPDEPRALALLIPLGVALITLRTALVLLVVPYLVGGSALACWGAAGQAEPWPRARPSRRALVLMAGALVVLPAAVLARPIALVLVVPLLVVSAAGAWVVLRLVGTYPLRGPLGIAALAVLAAGLGGVLGVVPRAAASPLVTPTVWLAGTFGLLSLLDDSALRRSGPRLFALPAAVIVGVVLAGSLLAPSFQPHRRVRLRDRFVDALARAQFTARNGYETGQGERGRQLQDRVPAGEPLAVWGVSFAQLDFTRNPIRDVSNGPRSMLVKIAAPRLDGIGWLLVEHVLPPPPRRPDAWGAPPPLDPIANLEHALVPEATIGTTVLYRVVR